MGDHVFFQNPTVKKRCTTHRTLENLIIRVGASVDDKSISVTKRHVTQLTFEPLFTGMAENVLL